MSGDAPARGNRFQKGRSGNPRGRPRARSKVVETPSAFDIIIDRTLTVTQGGRTREMSVDEALQHKTYQQAIAGSRMAQRTIMAMIERREKALGAKAPAKAGVTIQFDRTDPGNADAALVLLGVARQIDQSGCPRLRLETWAVQAAVDRRRRSGMTSREIESAKYCCLDTDAVRWPQATPE